MAEEKDKAAPPVRLTEKAIEQVKVAIKREHAPKESGLRILLINTGGGYRYDMQFETEKRPGDHLSNQGGILIYVDIIAKRYLQGTTLDFVDSPRGSGFLFERNKPS